MATAEKKTKVVPEYVPATVKEVKVEMVSLELTMKEAETLKALVGSIGGDEDARWLMSNIYRALDSEHVGSGRKPDRAPQYDSFKAKVMNELAITIPSFLKNTTF